jgi:hypothetical protein
MSKKKNNLTAAQRTTRRCRKAEYMTVFLSGKQKMVRRPPTIDGLDAEEFIRRNADVIWLHQHERWEEL